MTELLQTTRSADGTTIAYEAEGNGPPLLVIGGALSDRNGAAAYVPLLRDRFTVVRYDRRGRGDSGDTQPFAPEREYEDLEALIAAVGGPVFVFGHSSGAAIALHSARRGARIGKLALYEPPFIVDDTRAPMPADYLDQVNALVTSGRRGDAVRLFMRNVGMPAPLASLMRLTPAWSKLKRVAHTLAYDAAVMGDTQLGRPLPAERWQRAEAKTFVIVGGKSPAFLHNGTRMLADLLPSAEHRVLAGQTHMVKAKVLAPLLIECFAGVRATPTRAYA
jgi:pimeloyl-ACP methyl ester carboxylesterase